MSGGGGYALDLGSPVSHVAASLDRAAPAALSVEEMAADYRHVSRGDLERIKLHESCADDASATVWLIRRAVSELTRRGKTGAVQLAEEDGRFRLIVPFSEVRWGRRPVYALHPDIHAEFGDPFNPNSGRWSENVRRNTGKDSMDGLRESMREFGWIEQLPAIQDERGVVIMGHRRMAVAAELRTEGRDIADRIETVRFGDGDEADAKRFRLAVASNLDAKPFTPEERKDIAEYLYGEREWTMARIGQALNVSQKTISKDLTDFIPEVRNQPAGRGRPKAVRKVDDPALNDEIRRRKQAGQPVYDKELAEQFDVSKGTVDAAAAAVDRESDWETAIQALIRLADRDRLLQMKQSIEDALAALGE